MGHDSNDITLKQLVHDTLRKGIPLALICVLGAVLKAGWDVYAFSQVNTNLQATVKSNEKSLVMKVDQKDFNKLSRKVDKILVGLCMINKKTCRLQLQD